MARVRWLEDARSLEAAALTYTEVGATAHSLPPGHDHVHESVVVGRGQEIFDIAASLVMTWEMHARSGINVARNANPAPGRVALLSRRVGPITVKAPCRVVYVVDEADRCGFAYGTLTGHPESGEELFLISLAQTRP